MFSKILASTAAAATLLLGTPALASTAVQSFTGGALYSGFYDDETVGFAFTSGSDITVTDFGWYSTDGFIDSDRLVGLWDAGGSLLGSAVVTAGTPDATGFRYVSVTPISLLAGQQYMIGGRDLVSDGDDYVTSVSNLVMGPGLTFVGTAVSDDHAGFAFPYHLNTSASGGRFGANFKYEPTAAVLEPGTWALLIAGFGLAGAALRARPRVAARVGA